MTAPICAHCAGNGRVRGYQCPNCWGTGEDTDAVETTITAEIPDSIAGDVYIGPVGEVPALPEGFKRLGYLADNSLTEPAPPNWDDSWPTLSTRGVTIPLQPRSLEPDPPFKPAPEPPDPMVAVFKRDDGTFARCPLCGNSTWRIVEVGDMSFTATCDHGDDPDHWKDLYFNYGEGKQ